MARGLSRCVLRREGGGFACAHGVLGPHQDFKRRLSLAFGNSRSRKVALGLVAAGAAGAAALWYWRGQSNESKEPESDPDHPSSSNRDELDDLLLFNPHAKSGTRQQVQSCAAGNERVG